MVDRVPIHENIRRPREPNEGPPTVTFAVSVVMLVVTVVLVFVIVMLDPALKMS